jgi:two-component system nitrate/nitrite response regulator NarL
MGNADVTRVLVVDGHELYSEALTMLLRRQEDVDLVGAAADAEEALALVQARGPDVILVDLDLPGLDGIGTTRKLRHASPEVIDDPGVIADAIAAGACGYVTKTRAVEELMDVIRRAAAGELVMLERDLAPVLDRLQDVRPRSTGERAIRRLTPRETEILQALALGETTAQVAASLGISALTVQSHVKSILAKLGVHSKIEAVTMAWRHGLAPTRSA